ncbi:uncharacterized protein [Diabrotica undecimpunctata]|uniref:uncharacterized protein n=1 Tax=Diabrotica undecimpunctata TaxID=50387 RepID=UPI003B64291A
MNKLQENLDISPQEFVDQLLNEGSRIPCDNTNDSFNQQGDAVPPYFDKRLFKIGQKLYHKHMYAMDVMHCFGVMLLYSIKSAFDVAVSAAGPEATVYDLFIRQMNTNKNLQLFYDADFEPGSREWKAITKTKLRHNAVSKGSIKQGFNALTQKEMVLGQWFIAGFNLVRGEMAGIHNVSEEEWRGFHHYWRVIGFLIGIEERFNVCSVPIDTTRKISEILLAQVFNPEMTKRTPEYLMVTKIVGYCWAPILPDLEAKAAANYTFNLTKPKNGCKFPQPNFMEMNWFSRMYYYYFMFVLLYLLKWDFFRAARNFIHRANFYLIKNFPIFPRIQCEISQYLHFDKNAEKQYGVN